MEIVYGSNYYKYLDEVKEYLSLNHSSIIKTKFAKKVSCWIYSTDDDVFNYELAQEKATERIGRSIPTYHLIDVWKYLKKLYGDILVETHVNVSKENYSTSKCSKNLPNKIGDNDR